LAKSFNEPCIGGLAEGHLDDMPDSVEILRSFCGDRDHHVLKSVGRQADSIVILMASQLW
jgi:hypothetical protein